MRNDLLRLAGKGAVGLLIGFGVWFGLSAPYTRLLASVSETVIRLSEWPPITSMTPSGTLLVISRSDVPSTPESMQLALASTDITFNFVLLTTLFAASGRALAQRNLLGCLGASCALGLVHIAAVVSFVKADYAANYGAWSAAHYGSVSKAFWTGAPYFYSVVGVHAFAFALWWLFRPSSLLAGSEEPRMKGSRRGEIRRRKHGR